MSNSSIPSELQAVYASQKCDAPHEIVVLSNSQLKLIFTYLNYQQLTSIRTVSKWFYFVAGEMMNEKFKNLAKEVESEADRETRRKLPSLTFLKVLSVVESEIKILEAHCLDYINSSMFYFYGGQILDYTNFLLGNRESEELTTVVSRLFMLVGSFLNTFDSVSEPGLLERSYHLPFSWFGKKLVDVMECYKCSERYVSLEPLEGDQVRWAARYEGVPLHSLLPPPYLPDSSVGTTSDMAAVLKYLRSHVRWNNVLEVVQGYPGGCRFERKIHLVEEGDVRMIVAEKSAKRESGDRGDEKVMELNIGLKCHKIFAPSGCQELLELLSRLGAPQQAGIPKSQGPSSETPQSRHIDKEDYELDLTIDLTHPADTPSYRHLNKTSIQICQIDNMCYIASKTSVS